MSCCTKTYNLGCFNNCSIIAVGLCETSGTYNGVFTYGNISTTITVTAIENEPFLFDLSLLNENATFTLAIYDENENQITLTIDSVEYDCFKVKTQVDSVKVTQGTIIGCSPMCKEIYDPNDENTAVLFTVAVDGTTITGDGTVGNPLIAIGGGGGGGIESIVAGDNITVDNTDPLNPIVSASGGGSSALFPNGIEFVNSSRDFLSSDAGKRIFIQGENVSITMPEANPFAVGDYVGIIAQDYSCYFNTEYGGVPIYPLKSGDGSTSECVILMNTEFEEDAIWLAPISTSLISNDENTSKKTALRYLYDQSQNAIPLSGTEIGKPVTGDIEIADEIKIKSVDVSATDGYLKFKTGQFEQKTTDNIGLTNSEIRSSGTSAFFRVTDNNTGFSNQISVSNVGIDVNSTDPLSRGLSAIQDFSPNITDLDYTQKIYVDSLATSKQDTLVSGTNIKTINGTTILGSGDMTVGGQVDILQIQMFI